MIDDDLNVEVAIGAQTTCWIGPPGCPDVAERVKNDVRVSGKGGDETEEPPLITQPHLSLIIIVRML